MPRSHAPRNYVRKFKRSFASGYARVHGKDGEVDFCRRMFTMDKHAAALPLLKLIVKSRLPMMKGEFASELLGQITKCWFVDMPTYIQTRPDGAPTKTVDDYRVLSERMKKSNYTEFFRLDDLGTQGDMWRFYAIFIWEMNLGGCGNRLCGETPDETGYCKKCYEVPAPVTEITKCKYCTFDIFPENYVAHVKKCSALRRSGFDTKRNCPHCSATFMRRDNTKIHIEEMHSLTPCYGCRDCGMFFQKRNYARLHRKPGHKLYKGCSLSSAFKRPMTLGVEPICFPVPVDPDFEALCNDIANDPSFANLVAEV